MAFHTEFRPSKFDEFLGNKSMIVSLKSVISKEKPQQAYLFHGPSGCGKTTLARIVADYFGCQEMDIEEMNMSDMRGIETARKINEEAHLMTFSGNPKAYIFDEVHKTTSDFQNAILKILEEPPKHVYFILCTTEPEKLLPTVKRRCAIFQVDKVCNTEMEILLKKVVKEKEGILADGVLEWIIKEASGCPSDALMLLQKVIDIDLDEVQNILQKFVNENKEMIDLCRKLMNASAKWEHVATILQGLKADPEKVRRAVLGYASAILLKEDNPRAALVIKNFERNFYDTGMAGLLLACYECFV